VEGYLDCPVTGRGDGGFNSLPALCFEAIVLLSQALKDLYGQLDAIMAKQSEVAHVTCKRGCMHCCQLLTLVTTAEGIYMAEAVFEREDWEAVVERLAVAAKKCFYDGLTHANYLDKKLRCPFLSAENDCEVYERRPACCRYHAAVTDPERCRPEYKGSDFGSLDTVELQRYVWNLDKQVEPRMVAAPVALQVLFCMEIICRPVKEKHRVLRKATNGIPDPKSWVKRYGRTLKAGQDKPKRILQVLP
jgi:Fe-S-cluster containining protein